MEPVFFPNATGYATLGQFPTKEHTGIAWGLDDSESILRPSD